MRIFLSLILSLTWTTLAVAAPGESSARLTEAIPSTVTVVLPMAIPTAIGTPQHANTAALCKTFVTNNTNNESGNGAISLVEGSNSGGIALTAASVTLSGQLNMSAASTTIRQTVATGLTATGTVLADSLALTSIFNRLTTVAAGTGANLLGSTGVFHCVQNLGANNLKLYPNGASGQINGAAAGTPITLASATRDIACCVLIASNTYMCSVSPGPAS